MAKVNNQRMTVEIEGDFVVFLIGMRINKPWKIHKWLPVFAGDAADAARSWRKAGVGVSRLSAVSRRDRAVLAVVRAPRSATRAIATRCTGRRGWRSTRSVRRGAGDVGIWHETYRVARRASTRRSTAACRRSASARWAGWCRQRARGNRPAGGSRQPPRRTRDEPAAVRRVDGGGARGGARARARRARCRSARVVALDGAIVGRGFNQPISSGDPTAHAEIVAIRAGRDARRQLPADRRDAVRDDRAVPDVRRRAGARADRHARLRRRRSRRSGAVVSTVRGGELPGHNHRFEVVCGVREEECRALMQAFFKERRGAAAPSNGPARGAAGLRAVTLNRGPAL